MVVIPEQPVFAKEKVNVIQKLCFRIFFDKFSVELIQVIISVPGFKDIINFPRNRSCDNHRIYVMFPAETYDLIQVSKVVFFSLGIRRENIGPKINYFICLP